jgi:hypothetical protein
MQAAGACPPPAPHGGFVFSRGINMPFGKNVRNSRLLFSKGMKTHRRWGTVVLALVCLFVSSLVRQPPAVCAAFAGGGAGRLRSRTIVRDIAPA